MLRYAKLLAIQLRASALLSLQYRLDFFVGGVMSLFWTAAALIPLAVLFQQRETVAGWTWHEALLVVAWFNVLKGVLEGGVQPALQNVVEHIRKGTLDFLLIKPVDSQFMVSTSRFEPWKAVDLLGGLALLGWALWKLRVVPSPGALLATGLLLVGAVAILYSLWILVVSLAFVVVKIDNLSYLFASIYDAARWPASVYRGALSFVFTFVIPLAVMTTYPALAILGRLGPEQVLGALGGALAFSLAARMVWTRAIGRYTSAGG
ncbi:ABC transporter permease [Vulgatibacter incomptus]|uniref:Conserved membrane protein, multidrug efflux associated n=1 Tax=Vulgatibacter incomptus TaxID=1391653 RepID=A0A0K1PF50_9BACT|nr:ABC-2 family transporter protein [Vulgatibacter incomptus]AKU92051.1 conserved membrane protein, multidrug efflux associated [Vulgatibacter incomptus]